MQYDSIFRYRSRSRGVLLYGCSTNDARVARRRRQEKGCIMEIVWIKAIIRGVGIGLLCSGLDIPRDRRAVYFVVGVALLIS